VDSVEAVEEVVEETIVGDGLQPPPQAEGDLSAATHGYNVYGNYTVSGNIGVGTDHPIAKLDVRGGVRTNGYYPVRIKRMENVGSDANVSTGIPYASYVCVATGWSGYWDIEEDDAGSNYVWTQAQNGYWYLRASMRSHNNHETLDVDVLCFRREIAFMEGASPSLFDPD
jgi:hypothetical protein